jgi:hypothetical protein
MLLKNPSEVLKMDERVLLRERVLDRLTLLRSSFAALLAKVSYDLQGGLNPREAVFYLGSALIKIHYVVWYALQNDKLEEAEDFIAGVDLAIDEYFNCVENVFGSCLMSFLNRVEDLAKEIFGAYPGLCFVFGDYRDCKCPKCGH